jgi:hypothetical protein
MIEYFNLLNQSEIIKNLSNPSNSLYIGLNAVHRVFELILIKTNNIDNAYFYSQKSYFYYLEYLEQIYKSELSQNLNHMDAVLFVYKKTIFDIHNEDDNNGCSSISNIISLNSDDLQVNEKEIKDIFNKIAFFTKTLFFWGNSKISFENRINICKNYLSRYLNRFESIEMISSYIQIIQEKSDLKYVKYDDLLKEMLNRIEKTKKINNLTELEKNEYFLVKFYIEQDIFQEKINSNDTKDLIKWLVV